MRQRARQVPYGALLPVDLQPQRAQAEVQGGMIEAGLQSPLQFVRRGCILALGLRIDGLAQVQHHLGLLGVLHRELRRALQNRRQAVTLLARDGVSGCSRRGSRASLRQRLLRGLCDRIQLRCRAAPLGSCSCFTLRHAQRWPCRRGRGWAPAATARS